MSRLVKQRWGRSGHSYSLDGRKVPGVTTVVGKATGKPALIKWAAREAALWAWTHRDEADQLGEAAWIDQATRASDAVRDRSAEEGRMLHELAAMLVAGHPVELIGPDGTEYPQRVRDLAEQVARFMDVWDVNGDTALVEAPVFHERLEYAGTLDLLATVRGDERWLLDYKTGQSGVWAETGYQLAAYRNATHVVVDNRDRPVPEVARTVALWVRPDGWEVVPVRTDAAVWQAFRAMLVVAEVQSYSRDQMVGAALPVPEVA